MEEIKDQYKTISKLSQGLYKEKGSKFLSFAFPVKTEEEIKIHQQKLRKDYFDARHHVFAWRLGVEDQNYRANDDGEPANSSGMPILGQIRSFELTNILIVVIRYFGGTKLGIPGLINAYKTAAKESIENNTIVTEMLTKTYRISFSYDNMNIVMRILKEEHLKQHNPIFEMNCSIEINVRCSECERIESVFNQLHNIAIIEIP